MSNGGWPSTVTTTNLRDARETDRLGAYAAGVLARRHYIWQVSVGELSARHMNSVLGNIWHLLNPVLQVVVYYLIFGLMLGTDRGVENFIVFLSIGVFVYSFTQKSTTAGARCLHKNRGLINLIAFPRAVLPITSTVTEALTVLPAFAVMLAVAVGTGERPTFAWLLIVPLYVMQSIFNAGAAMVAARAADHVADIQQLLPFIFRLGFYASGVLFDVDAYVESSKYRLLFELNPLYCFIEIYRHLIIGTAVGTSEVVSASVWTVALAVVGFTWFRAGEENYGRD